MPAHTTYFSSKQHAEPLNHYWIIKRTGNARAGIWIPLYLIPLPWPLVETGQKLHTSLLFSAAATVVSNPVRNGRKTMPASFSLRMRFCSRNCRSLMGQVVGPIAGKALLKRRKQPHFESFRLWLPILESGDEVPKYRYSMIKEYNTEFLQASNNSGSTALDDLQKTWAKRAEARSTITVNARALCEWAISYEAIKSEVLKSNVIFLKAVKPAGTTFGKMMKSPTLAKHFNAFNRDLEKITFTVWYAIRRIVVQEIRDYDTALPSTGPIQRCKQCPSSTRIFTLEALLHHSLRMHDDTSNLPTLQTGRERLCNLCLKSRKLFSAEGMTAHIKAKHPALIPYP